MPINRHRWTKGGGSGGGSANAVIGPGSSVTDNAIVRWDGTTGTLVQDSGLTLSDAVSGSVTLGTASNGNIALVPNGTGAILHPIGSATAPGISFNGDANTGIYSRGADLVDVTSGGTVFVEFDGINGQNAVILRSATQVGWQSGAIGSGLNDSGLARTAASIVRVSNGGAGLGWLFSASPRALAADATNATATMANLTGLTFTLLASRKYTFRGCFFFENSVAAEGAKFDFDGGTATATDFRCRGTITDTALLSSATTTAIATDFTAATTTGASVFEFSGSFEVNAAGTFIPRFAENATATGTLTVHRGSYLWCQDTTYA